MGSIEFLIFSNFQLVYITLVEWGGGGGCQGWTFPTFRDFLFWTAPLSPCLDHYFLIGGIQCVQMGLNLNEAIFGCFSNNK